jgi:hypothetical protein
MKKSEIDEYGKKLSRKHKPAGDSKKTKAPEPDDTEADAPADKPKRSKKIQDYF